MPLRNLRDSRHPHIHSGSPEHFFKLPSPPRRPREHLTEMSWVKDCLLLILCSSVDVSTGINDRDESKLGSFGIIQWASTYWALESVGGNKWMFIDTFFHFQVKDRNLSTRFCTRFPFITLWLNDISKLVLKSLVMFLEHVCLYVILPHSGGESDYPPWESGQAGTQQELTNRRWWRWHCVTGSGQAWDILGGHTAFTGIPRPGCLLLKTRPPRCEGAEARPFVGVLVEGLS